MRMASWLGAALIAVAFAVVAEPNEASARDGIRGAVGYGRAYGSYAGGYRSYGGYRGYGGAGYYSRWNYGRPYMYGYGLRSYGYPFGYRRYGYPYAGYGYGLGYYPYYYGYGYPYVGNGLLYGTYSYPYYDYGGYGYGYPYSLYRHLYSPSSTDVQPATPSEYIADGEQDFKAGRYNIAIREWEHAMVDNPRDGALSLLMGQALFATGQFDEAAGAVQHGLSMMPEDQWGMVISNYRQLYGNPSDYSDQLKALEAASAQRESAALSFLLAYNYGYLGYPREAVRELDKVLALNSQDQLALKLKQIMTAKLPAQTEPEPAKAEPQKE
jgi:hypothetical protein